METHTQKLLERLRRIAEPPTDYQLAKMLGVERQHVHNWLKRGTAMDLVTAYRLADLLREDRAIIAGMVELDKRNLSPQKREMLEHMLPRRLASTSVAVLALLAALIPNKGETANATDGAVASATVTLLQTQQLNVLYIMRTLWRRLVRGCAAPWRGKLAPAAA